MHRVAVGLSVRDEHIGPLLALPDRDALDVLEIMIDDGLDENPRSAAWRTLGARWPLIAHGTELGIGAADGVSAPYVARVASALKAMQVLWYSEHLAFLSADEHALGHFGPLSHNPETLEALRDNAGFVAAAIPCPLLLENSADVLGWETENGGAALGEIYGASLEASSCGGLLDLTNLVIGARNDGYDPVSFLEAAPLERVVEIHLAGGRFDGALWIDSHDHDVDDDAYELLRSVIPRAPNLRAIIIERDERLPPLSFLLMEVLRAREVVRELGRA